jgi:tricorn protease
VDARVGDAVLTINGQRLTPEQGPQHLLVNQAETEVQILLQPSDGPARSVTVRALGAEFGARYREWVEANRRLVHGQTNGRVGYVHIPDMWADGYAEFHRYYLAEYDHEALIVDVRWNGGGAVSGLVLEKLARPRLGYGFQRWSPPNPYIYHSPRGKLVAITDENAGSDGDIFSHAFKMMGLGPLIGKRTWGGVIGISPSHHLVDGTVTTQPEYSFWFKDVGWNVENYGTDPDIEVDVRPQDYARGVDPQLDRGIQEILAALERNPPHKPDFGGRPNLARRPGLR